MRSPGIKSMVIAALLSPGAPLAGQWRAPPSLHRWSAIERIPRHRAVATKGVPAPYGSMRNPLPFSSSTISSGSLIYAAHCQSCHGRGGSGGGSQTANSRQAPFDLAWLSEMKISRYDGFMYWTIAEGGAPVGSTMPAFKDKLSAQEIWAVSSYIRAALPASPPETR